MTVSAPTTKRRRRFRTAVDIRMIVGVGLVVASIAGVWAVVASADDSVPVYAAGSTIVAGDTVGPDDLVIRRVSLGAARELYIAPGGVDAGSVATRTVFAGELVPAVAISRSADIGRAPVVVTVGGELAEGVAEGHEVDVWASEVTTEEEAAPPSVLVAGAIVSRVITEESLVSTAADISVELSVPDGSVAVLLAATTAGDALALVPVTGRSE
jgi:hypothetical protein